MEHEVAHAVGRHAGQRALQHQRVGAAFGEDQAAHVVAVDRGVEGALERVARGQGVHHMADARAPGQELPVGRLRVHVEMAVRHARGAEGAFGGRGGAVRHRARSERRQGAGGSMPAK
ncbi:hypothetical protein D3C72_1946270 [compost metagenome]